MRYYKLVTIHLNQSPIATSLLPPSHSGMGRGLRTFAMELTQLKYFQTVARLEHMTQAAQALCITQPSLSQAISRLEDELGIPLFERSGRNIRLTPYGTAFLAWVDRAFADLEAGKREVADMAGSERGLIRFGASSVAGLGRLIHTFQKQHPHLTLRLSRPPITQLLARLLRGDLDLCRMPACSAPGVAWVPLRTTEIVLAVPPTHRFAERESIRLSEAADENFLLFRPGNPFRELTAGFCRQAGFEPHVVFDGEATALSIVEFVRAGLGVTFLLATAGNDVKRSAFVPVRISEPVCQQTLGLAWREDHYLSQAARAFREFIIDYYASNFPLAEEAD